MIKRLLSRFTMIKGERAFYDRVAGKHVYYWTDCYFNKYLAISKWGYRVKCKN